MLFGGKTKKEEFLNFFSSKFFIRVFVWLKLISSIFSFYVQFFKLSFFCNNFFHFLKI